MKLIIWDLDDTLWEGTYVYDGDNITLKPDIKNILEVLDNRGFLQTIASRNPVEVLEMIIKFGLSKYFILPQISWHTKDIMIGNIINLMHILPKDIAFIDDLIFNLTIVKSKFKDILCINACDYDKILEMDVFKGSRDGRAKKRKEFFEDETKRLKIKEDSNSTDDFLNNLDIFLEIKQANDNEIINVLELLNRTNQLNATGKRFDNVEELKKRYKFHHIIIGYPEDRLGSYGLTLVAICKPTREGILIDELIVSCRILDRKLLPCFLKILQKNWNRFNMFIRFIPTKYNNILKEQLKDCGFIKEKFINHMIINKRIKTNIKVRIINGI
ncbi:hypothetical protein LCGC14_1139950 [marine sediment metagenome]|uniref:FCP1 homology domain-containing protein n=1 Tax=marine sediment metagenome TaxID=412755 RepID=A0A0F9Q488_9ZZZZ